MAAAMLPITNIHLKDLYGSTLEFFALRSPSYSYPPDHPGLHDSEESASPTTYTASTENFASDCRDKPAPEDRFSPCPCGSDSASGLTLPSMHLEPVRTKAELVRSRTEVVKLEERCKMLERTLQETRELLKARELELEKLKAEAQGAGPKKPTQASNNHPQRKHDDNKQIACRDTRGNFNSETSWARTMTVRLEQSTHARSLDVFLTKTDLWSGSQVIQAVQDMNSEILQFAASASESCSYDRRPRADAPKAVEASHDISSWLAPQLTQLLSTRDHSQDPILVQFALQGCVTLCVASTLSSFCLGFPSKPNVMLSTIYLHIASSEPQPISARWRALTHRSIHKIQSDLDRRAANEMAEVIFRLSSQILLISRCLNSDTIRDVLQSQFSERVQRIAKAACKLAHVIKEDILSTNFDVIAVGRDDAFNAQLMSDTFGDYGTSRGSVLCTTELGLRCTTRKIPSGGSSNAEAEGSVEKRLLLRPKVLLESVVDVLDP